MKREIELFFDRNLIIFNFFFPLLQRIQINTVDIKVIDSHVIPNHVIFLRPSELQPPKRLYDTAAMAPFFPVLVEVEKEDQEDKCKCPHSKTSIILTILF